MSRNKYIDTFISGSLEVTSGIDGATLSRAGQDTDERYALSGSTDIGNQNYLRLDTANGPVTGRLSVGATGAAGAAYIKDTGAGAGLILESSNGTASDSSLFFYEGQTSTSQWKIALDESSSNRLYFQENVGNNIIMTLNQDGDVGIGKATPSFNLDVAGDMRVADDVFISDSNLFLGTSKVVLPSNLGVDWGIHSRGENAQGLLIQGGTPNQRFIAFQTTHTTKAGNGGSGFPNTAGYSAHMLTNAYWDYANSGWRRPRGQGVQTRCFSVGNSPDFTWWGLTTNISDDELITDDIVTYAKLTPDLFSMFTDVEMSSGLIVTDSIGIGIATATETLHVEGGNILVDIGTADSNPLIRIKNDAETWQMQVRGADSDTFVIRNGSDNRIAVDTAGNVGVGITAPAERLHVSGGDMLIDGQLTVRTTSLPQLNLYQDDSNLFTSLQQTGNNSVLRNSAGQLWFYGSGVLAARFTATNCLFDAEPWVLDGTSFYFGTNKDVTFTWDDGADALILDNVDELFRIDGSTSGLVINANRLEYKGEDTDARYALSGVPGTGASLSWEFDSSTSMANPGRGKIRFNNATDLELVTSIAMNGYTNNGVFIHPASTSSLMNQGNFIYIQQIDDPTKAACYLMGAATAVNEGFPAESDDTWAELDVSGINLGTGTTGFPDAGAPVAITSLPDSITTTLADARYLEVAGDTVAGPFAVSGTFGINLVSGTVDAQDHFLPVTNSGVWTGASRAFPIYDVNGTLLGYVPIYAAKVDA